MRRAGWWLLCAALFAPAASAEPMIVDPTPPDDDLDWGLLLEPVDLGAATLETPSAMLRLGTRIFEEILVLEKHTGRVRHFAAGVEQPIALDLPVDTCGERGLLDVAAHPFFDRGALVRPDPTEPRRDWIYLSYHTAPGAVGDGCHGEAEFRVVRYTWTGSALVAPAVVFSKPLAADETTELGGAIAFGLDIDPDEEFVVVGSLFIGIGALGRDGRLQNNKEQADGPLDDTSVVLRLEDDGSTPPNNPFDLDEDVVGPEERYFAYGIRDPRSLAVDPPTQVFSTRVWASERSDAGNDEIEIFQPNQNSGYSPYQGTQFGDVPPNLLESGEENDAYPLVDLIFGLNRDDEEVPISTYADPPFTFESPEVGPTGLAFGGVEAGPIHGNALFVGTEDGRLLRFAVDNQRASFLLGSPLADTVADIDVPEPEPKDPKNPELHDDDLAQIVIATGFGAISDLETSVDGSIYVVDQDNGALYRVFSDAVRDLRIASIKVPKKIGLSDKKPVVTKAIRVTLLNRGEVAERIFAETGDDPATPEDEAVQSLGANLAALIDVQITSDTGCAAPATRVVVPKYAMPPHAPAIGIAPDGGRLTLDVEVDWTCDVPSPKGTPDFETSASIDMQVLGILEAAERQADNVCPRPPDPDPAADDRGCGAKTPEGLGGPMVTDVTRK